MGRKGGTIHNDTRKTGVSWGRQDMGPLGLCWLLACWLSGSLPTFHYSKSQGTDLFTLHFPGCLAHQQPESSLHLIPSWGGSHVDSVLPVRLGWRGVNSVVFSITRKLRFSAPFTETVSLDSPCSKGRASGTPSLTPLHLNTSALRSAPSGCWACLPPRAICVLLSGHLRFMPRRSLGYF